MNLWDQVLTRIESKINRHSFYTWFRPTTFAGEDAGSLTVRVPNPLFRDWITKHYSGVIAEALDEIERSQVSVQFVADSQTDASPVQLTVAESVVLDSKPVTVS